MTRRELTFTISIPVPTAGGLAALVRGAPGHVWRTLLVFQERAESRAILRSLDDRMRRDMGITYEDALREADKPFWRP